MESGYSDTSFNAVYIEFSVQNIAVKILLYGSQDIDIAEAFARIMFDNIQKAGLVTQTGHTGATGLTTNNSIDVIKANKSYGFYLVGSEIASGIWRNDGNSDNCYWEITDSKGEIIENFLGMTGGTMYIPSSAFQVQLEKECGDWEYLGEP